MAEQANIGDHAGDSLKEQVPTMEDHVEKAGTSTVHYTRATRKRTLEQIAEEAVQPEQPGSVNHEESESEAEENPMERGRARTPERGRVRTPERRHGEVTRDLKLKMPEYKGKKGSDPQVHVQAFESWAEVRGLPRHDWRVCFPQTLRGTAQKWYFNYPPTSLTTFKQMSKALVERFKEEKSDEELLGQLGRIKQKKTTVRQFVEEIKDLARQLSSPPGK